MEHSFDFGSGKALEVPISDKQEHMRWQVERRSENQESCLKLFELLEKHPKKWIEGDYFFASQAMIGAAFSLWRAVFLSNKEGTRNIVFKHSKDFLESVVLDNAISFPQDKKNNEWTFNYYVSNARYRLVGLEEVWPSLVPKWEHKGRDPKVRWVYAQKMLSQAIDSFDKHLTAKVAKSW